jgi:hypothetical protein
MQITIFIVKHKVSSEDVELHYLFARLHTAVNDFQLFHFLHYAKFQLSLGWNNMVLQQSGLVGNL